MFRKMVTIGFSLLSFQSVACPDLAGTYKRCINNAEDVESVKIEQSRNKITFVTDVGTRSEEVKEIIADGKMRIDEYDSEETYECSNNQVIGFIRADFFGTSVDITQKIYKDGEKIVIDIYSEAVLENQIICE